MHYVVLRSMYMLDGAHLYVQMTSCISSHTYLLAGAHLAWIVYVHFVLYSSMRNHILYACVCMYVCMFVCMYVYVYYICIILEYEESHIGMCAHRVCARVHIQIHELHMLCALTEYVPVYIFGSGSRHVRRGPSAHPI